MKTKIFSCIAFLSVLGQACAENFDTKESIATQRFSLAPPLSDAELKESQSNSKVLPFLSCYVPYGIIPMPGAGVSVRSNNHSLDVTANTFLILNTISVSGSIIRYFHPNQEGSYFSFGVGGFAGNVVGIYGGYSGNQIFAGPMIPVRFGQEFKKGFWDLGLNTGWAIKGEFPIIGPEVRCGIKF